MKRMKFLKNKDGLTLLEVLIAMLIMSLSLLLLLNMAVISIHSNDWSKKTTIATRMMQQKLEQLRNEPNLSAASSGYDTGNGVHRKWKVTSVASHLRQVDVYVIWEDIKGQTKTNSITTYIKTDSI